jgi:hypothetical protein
MFEWIKNLFIKKEGPNVLELDNKLLQEKIDKLEDETVPGLVSLNNELKTEILTANNKLAEYVKEEYQETYWNDKRPKASGYTYPARPNILTGTNNVQVDPRIFWTPFAMPSVTGSNDEIAKKSLQHVIDKTKYTSDTSQFKDDETWLFAFETSNLKKGDCEDGAIYLANILLSNGVPYWRIRLNAGDVQGGGHCWVTYLRESDNKWIVLDWCYWPDESIEMNLLWDAAEKYFDIWFSFNQRYIYLNEDFERKTSLSTKKNRRKNNGTNKRKI